MAQSFLFFMPISQESLLLIFMPNSAITVSQMHIPSKTHLQEAVGGVQTFFCGHSSRMKVTSNIKLCFKQFSLHAKKIFKQFSMYWEASIFISDNGVLTLFCFRKTMCVLGHQESDFQLPFFAFEC